ncbi:MAG TPA: CRISPR-associated endonuclease Cas1 [Chthoniobacteraceae bacterium]|jgi:CRISPR-associated protein Cas1
MRERKRSGRGEVRRSGGDGEPDLFAKQLSEVVQQAFAETSGEAGVIEATVPSEALVENRGDLSGVNAPDGTVEIVVQDAELEAFGEDGDELKVEQRVESIPARMLNEFVYCPRLFYYEHVEGVFVESVDTVKGAAVHARVDKGKGALPAGKSETRPPKSEASGGMDGEGPADQSEIANPKSETCADEIHSRSVMLGSERLGVVAKMDLVEATLSRDGTVAAVQPVDYKVGAPREGVDGLELWDADKMQLGLQCLVLRDNGYACDTGIIYYRKTKQRVPLELTPELEAWVVSKIGEARVCARGPIPPPLIDSPKCARCSLAPVCLPDETRMLSIPTVENFAPGEERDRTTPISAQHSPSASPRRLIAPRDEKRALYLNTQGYRVGCNDAVLKVKEKDRLVEEVRVMDVCHVALFGNIQMSTQAVQRLCDEDIPVTWFSMGGWFYGMTRGHSLKNVLLRIEQFRHAADPASCLRLAQQFVRGKIHNHRVIFMRNHVEPPERTKLRLGQAREDALATRSLEELLGTEGAAASVYFAQFGGMIRERIEEEDFLEGIPRPETAAAPEVAFTFDFTTRNRRPPTDPVNALLSLAYSLLAKECTLAACAVGLDPYVGFYHQPRHGRPALALDLMEEFRPLIAESAVLTAINNRFVSTLDFVSAGRAVNLSAAGRKKFFQCFEQRMNSLVTHPVFDYKVSYRRALELQFRILARVLTGEIPEYVPFLTR